MPRRCACGRSARRWTEEVECLLEPVKTTGHYRTLLKRHRANDIGPCVTLHSLVPRSDGCVGERALGKSGRTAERERSTSTLYAQNANAQGV
jgi:hypothetical protein